MVEGVASGDKCVQRCSPSNCHSNVTIGHPRDASTGMVDKVDVPPGRPGLDVCNSSSERGNRADWPTTATVVHHSTFGSILCVCNAYCCAVHLQEHAKPCRV
jgi:hypothetical protein